MPPIRFARRSRSGRAEVMLGVVLVVLLIGGAVGGFFLYQQRMAEAERAEADRAARERERQTKLKEISTSGKPVADLGRAGVMLDTLMGGSKQPTAAETKQTTARLRPQLIGTWRTKPGKSGEPERVVEYRADGTYRDALTGGRTLEGDWKVTGATGQKVLKVERTGGGPMLVRVTFEDGELIHDGDEPGSTVVLVKS